MKTCVVWGDMSSDLASEQYPTIQLCDGCLEYGDDEYILSIENYNPIYGDACELCHKTKKAEEQE